MPYIIKEKTLALIPEENKTKIIEIKDEIILNESINQILEHNCCLNGSTFEGRRKGTAYLIGASYKPPIIINEMKRLILLPTHSHRNHNCAWLVLQNILKYRLVSNNETKIIFQNNKELNLKISYSKFDKQILRATRLESALKGRKY